MLGTTGLYFVAGADAALYIAPFLLGIVLIQQWLAGPLRQLGRYTLGDVLEARLGGQAPRMFAAITTIAISLIYLVAQLVGTAGLPHVLIRAFTVPDARAARRSMIVAGVIIGTINIALFAIISPATIAQVAGEPLFRDAGGGIAGGTNLVVIHLARALGDALSFGITAAVAFATILAAVAGLGIAIASAAAHDLYPRITGGIVPGGLERGVFAARPWPPR